MAIENKYKKIVVSGKRKTAVARATITGGSGRVSINGQDHNNFQIMEKLRVEEPLRIAQQILGKLDFDVSIQVQGGGEKSQMDAARLALARAIVEFSKNQELQDSYVDYDRSLLVADVRRKETYKPGDSKARSKRQKSYR